MISKDLVGVFPPFAAVRCEANAIAEHRETSGDDEVTGKVGGKHQAYLECEEGKVIISSSDVS